MCAEFALTDIKQINATLLMQCYECKRSSTIEISFKGGMQPKSK